MNDKTQPTAYPLRMPASLRGAVEDAARDNKRSLNAEIIARLEESIAKESLGSGLPSADKARELSAAFRRNLPARMKSRIAEEINYAITQGRSAVRISLTDNDFSGIPEEDLESMMTITSQILTEAGYSFVWHDNEYSLWISFVPDEEPELDLSAVSLTLKSDNPADEQPSRGVRIRNFRM